MQAPAKAMPMDNSMVYLGETCGFDVTLSNQGAPVSAVTLKVEFSVEGGSTAVLYDNSQTPMQQLPYGAQEQLRVQTDIKEQGLITIVASAVFTDQSGERKYHVQFFKFSSASPVSVRTRVRHLPHAITAGSNSSSAANNGCGVGRTRCFLEVNVQNSTQLVMQLHAVRLLAAPGVAAQQIAPLSGGSSSSSPPLLPQGQQQQALPQDGLPASSHHQQHDQQSSSSSGSGKAHPHNQPQLAPAGSAGLGSSDTQLLQDIDTFAGSSSTSGVAGVAPSVQHKQLQQQLNYDQSQQQQGILPFLGGSEDQQQQAAVPLPAGCSHNSLWQVDHQLAGAAAGSTGSSSSTGAGPPPPLSTAAWGASGPSSTGSAAGGAAGTSSSGSSSTLGRLELHWSTCDGRTGRLLTQPLTGPVPASGKEVLMQLHQVVPGLPAAHAGSLGSSAAAGFRVLGCQQLTAGLTLNQPFTATFTLTAGPHDMGPLLVLYTTTAPPPPTSSGSAGGSALASSSSAQLATDSSSIQVRRLGGGAGGSAADAASDSSCPEVVVQGSRSRRIPALAAGQSVDVPFELLPLRCGWLRLPTFVVASEADGRLLDGVHDVNILVV